MTKKTLKILTALTALATLTACDESSTAERRAERSESTYRQAMADYQAGRMDESLRGFRETLQANPANSSARFQYACLLQDVKHDMVEASYAYHEYLLQNPDGDKTRLARDRLATCERAMAKSLAEKYALEGAELAKEVKVLRTEYKDADERAKKLEKELAVVHEQMEQLTVERDRLVKMVKGESAVEEKAPPTLADAKALLEEDDTAVSAPPSTQEVKDIKAEEKGDLANASSLLPKQAPNARQKRDEEQARLEAKRLALEKMREANARPDTYVVQKDDTLYKIAMRFYGRPSAWKLIRNANRTVISNDGRVKAGMRIVLPK